MAGTLILRVKTGPKRWAPAAGAGSPSHYELSAAQSHRREPAGRESWRSRLGAEFAAHTEPPVWE